MFIPIVFIILALLFYSISIWSEKFEKVIKPWMVMMMFTAFTCDMIGTGMMFMKSDGHIVGSHMICGYIALVIMSVHLIWAFMAAENMGKAQEWFNRFSIYAWCLWIIAFLSGIPVPSS